MWQPPESPYGPPVGVPPPKPPRPVWVQIGLLGVGSRRQAMGWYGGTMTGSIVGLVAVFLALYVVLDFPLFISVLAAAVVHVGLSLASLWYWLCIRWMDEHDGW